MSIEIVEGKMSRLTLKLIIGIGMTAGCSHAYAQTAAPASGDSAGAQGTGIQEIVVTAEKRSDKLKTLPNSISVYTGSQLTKSGVVGVSSLTEVAPSVVFGDSAGEAHLNIRGIGNELINIGGESGVSITQDGVPLASPLMAQRDFMDVGNVEVLRGPQGTVSGRNSPGGAINIISSKPTDAFEGDVSLGYGNFNRKTIKADLSGPVVGDTLLARLAVGYVKDDGWLYDTTTNQRVNSLDNIHYRGYLLYKPSSNFTASFILDGFDDKGFQIAGVDAGRVQPNTPSFSQYLGLGNSFQINNLTFQQTDPGPRTSFGQQYTLRMEWNVGGTGKLTSTSSYQHFRQNGTANYYAIPEDLFPITPAYVLENIKQVSEELTYTTNIGSRADLVAGVLALDQHAHEPFGLGATTLAAAPIEYVDGQTSSSVGLYAQFRYKLTDQLRITLGGRETFDKKTFSETLALFGPATPTSANGNHGSWNAFTPRVALDYTPSKDLTLYANFAKGYTGGGFNSFSGTIYNPEYVTSFEAGLKSYLLDHKIKFNLAGFHSNFKNIQTTVFVLSPGGVTTSLSVFNAPGAQIDGIESELEAKLGQSLRLTANGTWLNARYTQSLMSVDGSIVTTSPVLQNFEGNRLPRSPRWQFNVGSDYTAHLSSSWNLDLIANYAWQDRIYFDFYNHPLGSQGAYGLLNLSAAFSSTDKLWNLSVYANNATDTRYWSNKQFGTGTPVPYTNGMIGEPRTYGVTIARRF